MAHEFHKPRSIYRDCEPFPEDTPRVRGYDFNQGVDHKALLQSLLNTGFQATQFGRAVQEVNRMIEKRKQPWKVMDESSCKDHPPHCPCLSSCTIFLGYTSNMISSGVRESIRYLAQHRMELLSSQRPDLVFHSSQRQSNAERTNRLDDYVVSKVDVLVTTAGGIEEDLIKCLGPVYLGEFNLSGRDLYVKRINRIGNLLMPEENYSLLMEWMEPILKQMLLEQKTQGVHWTPSKVIQRFGKEINHPESVCYWAYKNDIPVFSPALTDGAIGDVLYLFSVENPGLIVDITEDISRMNSMALAANSSGIIILGGGVAKHHICNANIWKKGADFAVYVNTAQEADGSDSGAKPDEAITWGKIKMDAKPVKVVADATLIFPLLVAETFAVNADKQ